MTAITVPVRTEPAIRWPMRAVAVSAAGCALLAGRPLLLALPVDPVALLVVLFGVLLAVGVAWPLAPTHPGSIRVQLVASAAGIGAFVMGRLLGGGHPPQPAMLRLIALNMLAALAEEAFFRRLVFASLAPGGAVLAIVGSALLFAVVHVGVYGAWVLPIDLAAGLVLSWQRWATGSWCSPAVTHCIANILVVL